MDSALTRRGLLAGGGVLLLGACTGGGDPAAPTPAGPPPAADPLLALLGNRETLLVRYDATGAAHPDLIGRLQPLRAQTAEQVVVLRLALALPSTAPSSAAASASAAPSASASASGSSASGSAASENPAPGPAVPPEPAAALAELRTAVRAGGAAAESVCLAAPAERAPLVGSLAAAAACHDLLLA